MRKTTLNLNKTFFIAKILKEKFPSQKIYLHKKEGKIIIYLTKKVEKIYLEEVKTLIKVKFPEADIYFEFRLTKE